MDAQMSEIIHSEINTPDEFARTASIVAADGQNKEEDCCSKQCTDNDIQAKSVLLKKEDNVERNSLALKNDSINLTLTAKVMMHNNDISNAEFSKCATVDNTKYQPEICYQESLCDKSSALLPKLSTSLECVSSSVILNNPIDTLKKNILNFTHHVPIIEDKDNTLIEKSKDNGANDVNMICKYVSVEQPTIEVCTDKINVTTDVKNINDSIKKDYSQSDELDSSIIPTCNIKTFSNTIPPQPTLADDSRLVKISLPVNPINIMQSNTQFLSKSRNFLNFITEKSTNIMERALLPQHLAIRYNPALRTTESDFTNKKNINESRVSVKESSTGLISGTETDALEKLINTHSFSNCANQENEIVTFKCESILSGQEQSTSSQCEVNNKICTNIEQNEVNLSVDNTSNVSSQSNKNSEESIIDRLKSTTDMEDATKTLISIENMTNSDLYVDHTVNKYQNTNSELLQSEILHIDEGIENMAIKGSKDGLLQHPIHIMLLKNYTILKNVNLKLSEKVINLEERNRILEAEKSGESFAIQIQILEKTVNKLTSELHAKVEAHETLKREYASANKERENMVMKYAVSEKQLIDTQRAKELSERKVNQIIKDQDLLQIKLRQVQGERTRICNILDGKCREVGDLQKEVEKLKEEVSIRDVKLKWTQTKLKTEMELQKETQQKLDKALIRINEMKEECEQVRRETQESIRKFQQSEENKAVTLDQQLKEQQARLILERHVTEDKEMLCLQLQKEVEVLKNRQEVLIEENNTLSLKIQDSEKSRLSCENNLGNLKIIAEQRQKDIIDLLGKVSHLETMKLQLQHKEQCLASAEVETEQLRLANEELQSDMNICRQREADMLDFTQKLTEKNVNLQSEFNAVEAKIKQLEKEHGPLHECINELNSKIKILEESLKKEQERRIEECEILARHVAKQAQLAQNLTKKLEEYEGENAVLKRKQQITTKEMTRELQQCRKRLEAFEAASPSNSLCITSRTASNTSLNTGDTLNGALSDNSVNSEHTVHPLEPSNQVLMDRIIKLQKINVKRAEKLDFLEEHTRTLVEELQKKTKIIQNYILHENFDAMGSNERDRHKAELARHGGIMASVYSQRISDENMTLELSLEINQKLQAVLEDALLKNITLKDNIDTLGEEIARLTMQNQQRQMTS